MNLTFLNGAFLFAALAALLPLLIHLISRRRVATVDFSSLRFLKELERKRIRRVRLRQILLLIVRSLIILAAALALARPTLKGSFTGGTHAKTSVAIIIDDSASMSREKGGMFSRAQGLAREIAGLLDDGDEAYLVGAGEPPRPLLSDGTFSPDVILEELGGMSAGVAATDYQGAVELASGLLAESRNLNRELYLIGDMQRSGWGAAGAARTATVGAAGREAASYTEPPDDTEPRTYVLTLAGPTANLGLSSVSVERMYGGDSGRFAVTARVSNYGRRGAEALVRLFVDGEQAGQAGAVLESGGTGTVRFAATVSESRWHEGWVEIPDDALGTDNRHYFVIPSSRRTEVLVVRPKSGDELDDADYIERALDPGSSGDRFSVSVIDRTALSRQDSDRFPVVVLADVGRLDDGAARWLRGHVAAGGGLLVVLGNRTDIRHWNSGPLSELSGVEIVAPIDRPDGVRAAPSLRGHPLLEGLVFGERLVDDVLVRRGFDVRAPELEEILELPGVSPLLVVDRRGAEGEPAGAGGEVAVLATSVDPSWSDLPRSGFVVPMLHRLAQRLSRTTSRPASVTVGEDLTVRLPEAPTGRVEVDVPDGRTVAAELREVPGPAAVVDASVPGVYSFSVNGSQVAMGAANVDPRESDLAPVDREEIEDLLSKRRVTFIGEGTRLEDQVLQARYGRELWRAFLYAAVVLLALEMYLARPRFG